MQTERSDEVLQTRSVWNISYGFWIIRMKKKMIENPALRLTDASLQSDAITTNVNQLFWNWAAIDPVPKKIHTRYNSTTMDFPIPEGCDKDHSGVYMFFKCFFYDVRRITARNDATAQLVVFGIGLFTILTVVGFIYTSGFILELSCWDQMYKKFVLMVFGPTPQDKTPLNNADLSEYIEDLTLPQPQPVPETEDDNRLQEVITRSIWPVLINVLC